MIRGRPAPCGCSSPIFFDATITMRGAVTEQADQALQVDKSGLPRRLESRRQALQVSGSDACPGLQHVGRREVLSRPSPSRPAHRGAGVPRCPTQARPRELPKPWKRPPTRWSALHPTGSVGVRSGGGGGDNMPFINCPPFLSTPCRPAPWPTRSTWCGAAWRSCRASGRTPRRTWRTSRCESSDERMLLRWHQPVARFVWNADKRLACLLH